MPRFILAVTRAAVSENGLYVVYTRFPSRLGVDAVLMVTRFATTGCYTSPVYLKDP